MGYLCRNFDMLCDRQFQHTLVLLYICVKTHNIHRNKKCSVFHICLFSERYDFCDFDIGCGSVSTNFVKHGPCGFRPFDFYSKFKNWKSKVHNRDFQCLIPQELKITNLQSQLSTFVSKKHKIEKQFSMF